MKKTTSLKASFWKFLCMLLIGLIGSVAIPFCLILVGTSTDFITYADYSERSAKNLVPIIAAAPDLTETSRICLLPAKMNMWCFNITLAHSL